MSSSYAASRRVAFAFCPRAIMEFDPDCLKNAFKSGECRVTTRGQRTVKRLSVYAGSQRYLADFVSFGDIAERQHKHILRLFPCSV